MSTNLENKLNAILNEKKEKILPQNIKKGVTVFDITGELEGLDTSDATATDTDIMLNKTAYVNGEKVTGTANPIETTVTPSATTQVKSGLFSKVTVNGDNNLIAENIKKDVTIFGVTGTAEGGSSSGGSEYNAKIANPGGTSGAGDYIYRWLREINELDLTGVTVTASMFSSLSSLISLPNNLNTSSVTTMVSMFNGCTSLVEIPSMDTSNVTNMQTMFSSCNSVITIPELNAGKVTNIKTVFGTSTSTSKVENLGGFLDLGKKYTYKSQNYGNYTLTLSNQISLTHNSLMNVINKLYDLNLSYNVASGGTLYPQQLVLGSTNLAKLTAEEIAIATNKGWSVS